MGMPLNFQPLAKYAQFEGRARRSEYWLWQLVIGVFIVGVVLSYVTMAAHEGGPINIVFGLVLLGSVIPSFAVNVRRLHDIDKSGFWLFIFLIPLLGAVVLFIFHLMDGTPGPNRYGEDPKGRSAA